MAAKTTGGNRAFQRLRSLVKEPGPHGLEWWYRVGEQVERLCPHDSRQYGRSAVVTVTESLGKSAGFATQLWAARKFFGSYSSEEVRKLISPAPATQFKLRWSHLLHLLSLDRQERTKFQKRCIHQQWSARELHRQIKIHRGQRGQGGRRYHVPESASLALRQVVDEAKKWSRFRAIVFGDGSPLLSDEQHGNVRNLEVLDEAIAALQQIKERVPGDLKRLQQLRRRLGRRTGRE